MMYYKNYIDTEKGIRGICILSRDHGAHPHYHAEDEIYELIYGEGLMRIGNTSTVVKAPYMTRIPGNIIHTISAISPFIILKYSFPRGPFNTIQYTWLPENGISKL